jgi:hypothetical protein
MRLSTAVGRLKTSDLIFPLKLAILRSTSAAQLGPIPHPTKGNQPMFFKRLAQQIKSCVVRVVRNIEQRFKQWTKPSNESLVAGTLADVTRGKGELIAENALLRQQVIILQRQTKRPQLTPRDRGLLVVLARWARHWKDALAIVKPATLFGWHVRPEWALV